MSGTSYISLLFHLCLHICIIILSVWVGTALLQLLHISW